MSVLCACECSQALTMAFRALGVDAWSCDLAKCQGSAPEFHLVGDCIAYLPYFDHIFAFPPCTHLSYANGAHLAEKRKDGRTDFAIYFFMQLYSHPHTKMVENPLGVISEKLPYSQIVSPEMFGSPHKKRTCLWLKGLPLLLPTSAKAGKSFIQNLPSSSFKRSILDPYLAHAMASQWLDYVH